jgi:hypothetical protein
MMRRSIFLLLLTALIAIITFYSRQYFQHRKAQQDHELVLRTAAQYMANDTKQKSLVGTGRSQKPNEDHVCIAPKLLPFPQMGSKVSKEKLAAAMQRELEFDKPYFWWSPDKKQRYTSSHAVVRPFVELYYAALMQPPTSFNHKAPIWNGAKPNAQMGDDIFSDPSAEIYRGCQQKIEFFQPIISQHYALLEYRHAVRGKIGCGSGYLLDARLALKRTASSWKIIAVYQIPSGISHGGDVLGKPC